MSKLYTVGVLINKFFASLFLHSSLLLLNSSCGIKGPTTLATASNSLALQEFQCGKGRTSIPTQSSRKIQMRISELDHFLKLYNQDHEREGKVIFRSMLGLASQSTPPSNPLVVGERENLKELAKLDSEWIKIVGETTWFSFLSNKKAILKWDRSFRVGEVNSLLRKYNRLLDNASRWNYLQCNLSKLSEKKKEDIRPLLKYKKFRSTSCVDGKNCTEVELIAGKTELINLCEAVNSGYICSVEFEVHQRLHTLKKFEQFYMKEEEVTFNSFFEINTLNKWKCDQSLGKTIIKIPYYLDQKFLKRIDHNTDLFESFVEYRWKDSEVQIKLVKVSSPKKDTVSVHWNESSVSFVNYSSPLIINMSNSLSGKNLMLIFAHELGHVMGFPDCYLEFYDKNAKHSVYYDLDFGSNNIMCGATFMAKAPVSYLRQITKSGCQNF